MHRIYSNATYNSSSDVVGAQNLCHRDALLEAPDIVVDEVSHDHELNQLDNNNPIADKLFDWMVLVGQLAEGGCPKDKRHQPGESLRRQEVRRV